MNIHIVAGLLWGAVFLMAIGATTLLSWIGHVARGTRTFSGWIKDTWLWVFGDVRKQMIRDDQAMIDRIDKKAETPSDEDSGSALGLAPDRTWHQIQDEGLSND